MRPAGLVFPPLPGPAFFRSRWIRIVPDAMRTESVAEFVPIGGPPRLRGLRAVAAEVSA